ncbi:MAG: hypothetical protein WCR58_12005 [Bacteroidales bacterium]|jgi:hypothetical protein|nr:hypothetical protein [Bacteroidales bacterium]MDD3700708.1 hypothetical protein [Bacteroidales bacterium]MDY0370600.1 hypothetical protein [Bacteroidales bacterium]
MVINELKDKEQTLKNFFNAMKELREQGILINNKDFTSQIGEWLVEMIFEGKRADSGIQKGWDIDVKGKHIQVKTHAKAETNKSRFSVVNKESAEEIDELIIVVFTSDYKLKSFYKVPWGVASPLIILRGKKSQKNIINWSSIKKYKIAIEELPHQEIVSLFL